MERSFPGARGVEIFRRSWLPDDPTRAAIVLVHGKSEHSGRYEHVAQSLVALGCAVHAYDQRGYGRSGGPRASIDRFDDYALDCAAMLRAAAAEHPDRPLFLLGHSLGGLVALYTAAYSASEEVPLAGVICSAPYLGLARSPWAALASLVAAASWLAPRAAVRPKPGSAWELTHDEPTWRAFEADPLVDRRLTLGWFRETRTAIRRLQAGAATIRQPLLFLLAGDDRVVSTPEALAFLDRTSSADRRAIVYEGFFHEVFNEVERHRPLRDLAAWLEPRLA